MVVLIIGCSTDSVESVQQKLIRRGCRVVWLKADLCLDGEVIGFSAQGGQPYLYAVVDGEEIDLSHVGAVWYLKPHLPKELRTIPADEHRTFIRQQFYGLWAGAAELLRGAVWISPYGNMVAAERKLYQLSVANAAGFAIPDTLVSTEPEKVLQFCERHPDGAVIKQLSASPLEDHVIFTNILTPEHLRQVERVRSAPSIYQAVVPKAHELRITVVGSEAFVARIENQHVPTARLDWRRPVPGVTLHADTLPDEVRLRCVELVSRLGLRFGCIDMVVTPGGEHVFLEVNPNGQWWFVETATGLPISDAIANLLCEHIK